MSHLLRGAVVLPARRCFVALGSAILSGLLPIACTSNGPLVAIGDGGPGVPPIDASPGTTDAAPSDGADAVGAPGPFAGWTVCDDLPVERTPRAPYAWSVSADGRWLALLDSPVGEPNRVSDRFQSVALWNLPATTLARRLDVSGEQPLLDVDLSADGTLVAVTGDTAEMRRTADGQVVWQHPPPANVPSDGWVRNFAFSPDGALLVSARGDDIQFFRATDGSLTRQLASMELSTGVAFSPDGRWLASSAPSLWQVSDQTVLWTHVAGTTLPPPESSGFSDNWAAFSPSGTLVVTQSARTSDLAASNLIFDTSTQLLDTSSGALVRDLGHGLPRRPTFSPDGRWIVAGDQLINLDSGARNALSVSAAVSAFLPDGRIAAAESAGAAHLLCPF